MIVYFANRKMEIVGQASTSLPKGYTIIEDTKIEEIETGVSSFECKIEFDNKSRLEIEEITNAGNYILRSNGDENEFYTIIETEIDTKEHYIYIYAEDAGLDLLNEVVGEYEATESKTAEWYINKYINDSGFEIGINEIPSTSVRKLKWDGEATCTERLASIANEFGGYEISYSYQISNMIITNKYVNIYKKRGKDVGIQLRLNRDIDRIITKKSVANLATAFRCTGGTPENSNTPITLKGYSYDDGDFYVGTDGVLRSRNACEKWSRYVWNKEPNQLSGYKGNIVRLYSYDTTSQSTLCAHAITELKKICDMEVNYEVEINKLPDNVKIGDRVNIVDDAGKLYLSTRILQLETSVTEQTQKATLGDYLIKNDGISQKVVELAEQLAQRVEAEKKVVEDIIIVKATADKAKTDAGDALTTAGTANETASSANETANYVRENYVDIAMTKIDNAWVQSLIVKGNLIAQDITADEGTFYKLTGVRVYGDVIQANSIKADSLILKNSEDGLYYRLNVDSLGKVTADSDPKYQEGIDGSVIVAESITASKLKVDKVLANAILAQDITATGTITGLKVDAGEITGTTINGGSLFIGNSNGTYASISSSGKLTCTGAKISGKLDLDNGITFNSSSADIGIISYSSEGFIFGSNVDVPMIFSSTVGGNIEFRTKYTTLLEIQAEIVRCYENLECDSISIGKTSYLNTALYLGSNTDSSGTRFYINNNGTGRFNTLFEDGTALSNKYQAKGTYFTNGSTVTGALYLGSNSHYVNNKGNGVFYVVTSRYGECKGSSRRFKENIKYRDNDYWHDRLMQVKTCTFDYTSEYMPEHDEDRYNHLGVIAEEVNEIFPELTVNNEDGVLSYVKYSEFVIPLISEVQRLNKKIEELEQKVGGNSAS